MRLRTIMGAATLLAAASIAVPSSAGAADDVGARGCHSKRITLPGTYAEYTECVSPGGTEVHGFVKDSSLDGECGYVSIYFDNEEPAVHEHVCGSGLGSEFNAWGEDANDARVYLSEY